MTPLRVHVRRKDEEELHSNACTKTVSVTSKRTNHVSASCGLLDDRLIHQVAQQRTIVRAAHGFLRHHDWHQVLDGSTQK